MYSQGRPPPIPNDVSLHDQLIAQLGPNRPAFIEHLQSRSGYHSDELHFNGPPVPKVRNVPYNRIDQNTNGGKLLALESHGDKSQRFNERARIAAVARQRSSTNPWESDTTKTTNLNPEINVHNNKAGPTHRHKRQITNPYEERTLHRMHTDGTADAQKVLQAAYLDARDGATSTQSMMAAVESGLHRVARRNNALNNNQHNPAIIRSQQSVKETVDNYGRRIRARLSKPHRARNNVLGYTGYFEPEVQLHQHVTLPVPASAGPPLLALAPFYPTVQPTMQPPSITTFTASYPNVVPPDYRGPVMYPVVNGQLNMERPVYPGPLTYPDNNTIPSWSMPIRLSDLPASHPHYEPPNGPDYGAGPGHTDMGRYDAANIPPHHNTAMPQQYEPSLSQQHLPTARQNPGTGLLRHDLPPFHNSSTPLRVGDANGPNCGPTATEYFDPTHPQHHDITSFVNPELPKHRAQTVVDKRPQSIKLVHTPDNTNITRNRGYINTSVARSGSPKLVRRTDSSSQSAHDRAPVMPLHEQLRMLDISTLKDKIIDPEKMAELEAQMKALKEKEAWCKDEQRRLGWASPEGETSENERFSVMKGEEHKKLTREDWENAFKRDIARMEKRLSLKSLGRKVTLDNVDSAMAELERFQSEAVSLRLDSQTPQFVPPGSSFVAPGDMLDETEKAGPSIKAEDGKEERLLFPIINNYNNGRHDVAWHKNQKPKPDARIEVYEKMEANAKLVYKGQNLREAFEKRRDQGSDR